MGGLQAEGGNVVNNIVLNNDSSDGTTVGNFSSDPCFVDAGQNDYHLGPGSLAINAAAPLAGVVNDLDGVAHASGANLSECAFPATLEPGRHTISLMVSNTGGDSASDSVVVSILPLTTYVVEGGDDEANFPYHTTERPAATFSAALSAVWKSLSTASHVFLAEGTYALGNPVIALQAAGGRRLQA